MRNEAQARFDELKAAEVARIQIEEPDLVGLSSTQKRWLQEHIDGVNARLEAKKVPETDFGVHVADLQLQAAGKRTYSTPLRSSASADPA